MPYNNFIVLLIVILSISCNKDSNSAGTKSSLIIPSSGYTTTNSYPDLSLIWADEFNTSKLDMNNWNYQIGNGCPDLCGWGNNEAQYYKKENILFQDGNLIIVAKNEKFNSNNYTSSRINTKGKFSFHYGRIDVRAALPVGQGIWPAIWMLGDQIDTVGWPASGEIDIMEMIGGAGRENTVYGTAHWESKGNHEYRSSNYLLDTGIFNDEFHVFSVVWNSDSIKWFVDDIQYHEVDISVSELEEFKQDFHFLINIAIGGNWPGNPNDTTTFPQYLIIDYIRVFQ